MSVTCGFAYLNHAKKHITAGQGLVCVSEGGLEPPCPFGALAPQASASAYSATRTGDAVHISWPRVANLARLREANEARVLGVGPARQGCQARAKGRATMGR